MNRRKMLRSLSALPVLGMASSPRLQAAQYDVDAITSPTKIVGAKTNSPLMTDLDKKEYARLKTLDLKEPNVAALRQRMPVSKIGKLTVGRLISVSNLISLHMHARDLAYVTTLAAHYNTEERIFMTLKKCEENGVNTIVLKNHNFKQFKLSNYWKEWGGQMQWIADVITTDIDQFKALLEEHLALGAAAVYLWGGASDIWYHQKQPDKIIKAYEIMKQYDIPVGIGAHRLEPIRFCEKEGLAPDFYIKTLHHDRYWSAHPPANRRYLEMFEKESPHHEAYHDNMFCHDAEETVAFMHHVKIPWIAFKVLAAGAIPPEDGFTYAFQNGADFICVGMFDFQIKQDVELARRVVMESMKHRKRALIV